MFDQLTVELDKNHLMLVEENEMNRSHDDVMVVDNNEEKKKTTRFDVVKVVEGDHEEYI